MNAINERLRRLIDWEYFPFLVFAALMGSLHFFMIPFRDDLVYGDILSKQPVLALMLEEYYGWSSRVIIMPVGTFFAARSFVLFSIIDSFFYFLLPYMISKLFIYKNKRENNWIVVLLLACVPFIIMMSTAGWVITSIHYLWPLTLGLVAMYPIKKVCQNESFRWFEIIFYLMATLFSANMEIMAAIIMTVYIIFAIYFVYKKTSHWLIILQTIILIGNMGFTLTCPGNIVRDLIEATARFPAYINLNFLEKLSISATASLISVDLNFLTLVVLGMAGIFAWNKYQTTIPRIICILPFLFGLFINFSRMVIFGQKCTRLWSDLSGQHIVYPIDYWKLVNAVPGWAHYSILMMMALFSLSFMLMTLVLFQNSKFKWIAFLVMGAGIMSRAVMGFSSTVYASGARTFLFLYIALAIYGVLLYQTFKPELAEKKERKLIWFLCVFAVMGFLQSCFYLFYINNCLV